MADMTHFARALRVLNREQRRHVEAYLNKLGSRAEAVYPYLFPSGQVCFLNIRLREGEGKSFRVAHFDENDHLVWKKAAQPEGGYPLFGGGLLARYPQATVFVCEGEKATSAVIDFAKRSNALDQFVAVTSGGAQSARSANWTALSGRKVILWPDNDAPGMGYMHAVSEQLADTAASLEYVDIAALNLPPGGDAADWAVQQAEAHGNLLTNLPLAGSTSAAHLPHEDEEPPLPLLREIGGRLEFPINALGVFLSAAARAIAEAVQCPPVMAGNAVLASAALVGQAFANVVVDGRDTPLSLFLLTIAPSGERKTAVDKLATAPIYRQQKLAQAHYAREMKAYRALLKVLPKGEVEPDPPIDPTILVEDVTIDALKRGLINGRPSQGLFMSEGGTFIGGYAMSKDHQVRTSTTLSALHSGEPISQTRVTGRHSANCRRLTVQIQVQPEVVRDFVSNEMMQAQGLLQRFLMSEPPSRIGSRQYRRHDITRDPAYLAYNQQLERMLTKALPTDDLGDLTPRALVLSDGAYELWIDAYNAIEQASAPGGALEHYQAYASKLPDQILRIAGVITLFEDAEAAEIAKTTMEGAITLANYYLHEAMHLLVGPADRLLARAKELLEWLKRYPSPIALRDIYRTGPKFVRSAGQARELLDILIEHGWVTRFEGKITAANGKVSKENYAVVADV